MPLALTLKKYYLLPRVHVCILYIAQNEHRLLTGFYYPVVIYYAVVQVKFRFRSTLDQIESPYGALGAHTTDQGLDNEI
jgi:hypothetical protein